MYNHGCSFQFREGKGCRFFFLDILWVYFDYFLVLEPNFLLTAETSWGWGPPEVQRDIMSIMRQG